MKSSLNKRFILIFALLILLAGGFAKKLHAQPQPQLYCLSVEANGSLSVSWEIPGGSFDGFRLYYKRVTDALFNSLDFPSNVTSGIIPVADAQTVRYEVFIITFNNSPPANSPESVHFNSMILNVSNGGIGTGIARLGWGTMNPGSGITYKIFRSDDNISFTEIGETQQRVFDDTINAVCDLTTFYYRVQVNNAGCEALSSVSSGNFEDDNVPADPTLTYVTIVNGNAEIHWTHSPTPDVDRYILGIGEGGIFFDHDTTDYVDFVVDNFYDRPHYGYPCDEVVTYVLRAKDQCDNESSGVVNYQQPHHTLLLAGDVVTQCNRKASLSWNGYDNMDPPVSEYQVFRAQGGTPATIIATVPATSAESYSYNDPEMLETGQLYSYYVLAVNSDNSLASKSCLLDLLPNPEEVSEFSLDVVSVFNSDYIQMNAIGEPVGLINEVEVFRSPDGPGSLQSLFKAEWNSSPLLIPETSAEVNQTSYYYQLVAIDRCGFELATSEVFRSIYLELLDLGDGNVRLNWNAFEGWGSGLIGYNLYRFDGGTLAAGFPKQLSAGTLVHNDFTNGVETGRITYRVDALRTDDAVSQSNEVVLLGEADVKVPNAFKVGGMTPEFKPLLKNVEPSSYLFLIYNQWGQLIFETKDVLEGWKGDFKGQLVGRGIYAYLIKYSDFNGQTSSKVGSVMVLR